MPDKKFLVVSIDGLIADIAWQVVKEGHPVKLYVESESEREIADGFVPKTEDWERDVSWADVVVFESIFGAVRAASCVVLFRVDRDVPGGVRDVTRRRA